MKVNDYSFDFMSIDYLSVDVSTFLPTLSFKATVPTTNLLTINYPKDNDIISVFLRPFTDFYKSIRIDFRIDYIYTNGVQATQKITDLPDSNEIVIIIKGEM